MDVSGQLHAPAALPPKKEPLLPIGLDAQENMDLLDCDVLHMTTQKLTMKISSLIT
jgi:hypothetical protein